LCCHARRPIGKSGGNAGIGIDGLADTLQVIPQRPSDHAMPHDLPLSLVDAFVLLFPPGIQLGLREAVSDRIVGVDDVALDHLGCVEVVGEPVAVGRHVLLVRNERCPGPVLGFLCEPVELGVAEPLGGHARMGRVLDGDHRVLVVVAGEQLVGELPDEFAQRVDPLVVGCDAVVNLM